MIAWRTAAEPVTAPAGRRPFSEIDFVVVDVETTGWSPQQARITEIGAVRVSGGQVLGQFSSLVNPGSAIPEKIAALTGISDSMVAAAPPPAEVLPGFLAFARGGVLTAHNAAFDLGFLAAACQDSGLAWPEFPVLDTVDLARLLLRGREVPDCKLATLAGFFRARTLPRHRALADALATADVLAGLLARLAAAGVTTLASTAGYAEAGQTPPWLAGPWRRRWLRARWWAVRYRRRLGIGQRRGRRRTTWSRQ